MALGGEFVAVSHSTHCPHTVYGREEKKKGHGELRKGGTGGKYTCYRIQDGARKEDTEKEKKKKKIGSTGRITQWIFEGA